MVEGQRLRRRATAFGLGGEGDGEFVRHVDS
jgi:hypothetical protein